MFSPRTLILFSFYASMAPLSLWAQTPGPDFTCFQEAGHYTPQLDIGSDMAVVYGVNNTFSERVAQWREKGYSIGMMTGIAWGGYDDYYQTPEGFRKDEVQTTKSGRLYMHGDSTTVGYNVPTDAYIEYIKKIVEPAVDLGAQAIFLEEPEYWAETGWSEAFKREWQIYYGEPWQEPDSSVDAQYRASRLKYELYFKALREVFRHIKARAAEQGKSVECIVPTHSLNNYAHWRIVSPMSHLMDLQEMDGYIAQVWTGTARSATMFRGVRKERTFESGFLEYSQMLAMVRPTGRKVWFLADPIEDNPNYSWNNYKLNYECTVISSLMWPEVHRFEVMPWPSRIFQGTYPKVDLDTKSADREGIPADYATELLTVINALNDMNQEDVEYDTGTRGIGVLVSDTLMFQRAAPTPSDPHLSQLYGLAMPLLKQGLPVELIQLENLLQPNVLNNIKVLLLTYEGQKPLKSEYHRALADWVRAGGSLLFVDDGKDPYNHVREWWNDQGKTSRTPQQDLLDRLAVTDAAKSGPVRTGTGWVLVFKESPSSLAGQADGASILMQRVEEMLQTRGETLRTQNYLKLRRGPYVIASVMDESVSEAPLTITGRLVDLLDPMLPVIREKTLLPNERTLLYDLDWADTHLARAKVAAAACRVREEQSDGGVLSFVTRGPAATRARMRILLPNKPDSLNTEPGIYVDQKWDDASRTFWLDFDNQAADVQFRVQYRWVDTGEQKRKEVPGP